MLTVEEEFKEELSNFMKKYGIQKDGRGGPSPWPVQEGDMGALTLEEVIKELKGFFGAPYLDDYYGWVVCALVRRYFQLVEE